MGGSAQTKAMKKVAGRLRLDLAQFRALEAFAQFGSELDKASQQQLARGARVVEVLKQPQYEPLPVEREVVMIWTATGGYLDPFPVEDARRFVEEFTAYLDSRTDVLGAIKETGDMSDETEATLKESVEAFAQSFQTSEAAAGSEAGRGAGTPPDEVKPDIGWDRMSSVDDDEEEEERAGMDPEVRPRPKRTTSRARYPCQMMRTRRAPSRWEPSSGSSAGGSARSSRRRRSRARWSSSRPRGS